MDKQPAGTPQPPTGGAAPSSVAPRTWQDQQRRLKMVGLSATNMGLVSTLLLLYSALGSVHPFWPLVYAACSRLGNAAFAWLVYNGRNLQWRDPNLFGAQMGFAAFLLFGAFAAMPELAGAHLCNLFVTAIFSAVQFTPEQARRAIVLASAAAAAALAWGADRVSLPSNRPIELALLWLYVTLSLVRFGLIAEHLGALRGKLRDKNRELEASLAHITHLAEHDALTDLLSRRTVSQRLERLIAPADDRAGDADALCVALLDLDHFKQVNDTHGHHAGDEVLRRFARLAAATLRKQDLLGRWGGEEFVLVLPACDLQDAERTLERIHRALGLHPWHEVAPDLVVSVSAGIAQHRQGEPMDQLLRRADQAAYEAKAAGRNRTVKAAGG